MVQLYPKQKLITIGLALCIVTMLFGKCSDARSSFMDRYAQIVIHNCDVVIY